MCVKKANLLKYLVLVLSLLATSVFAEPMAYESKPRVEFKLLTPPRVAGVVNPRVQLKAAYQMIAKGTSQFSGLSDLILQPAKHGFKVVAISDFGAFVEFNLDQNDQARLRNSVLDIDILRGDDGAVFANKILADSEALTRDAQTQDLYVAFEGQHRVMRYAQGVNNGELLPLKGLPTFPANQGIEAMTLVRDEHGVSSLLLGAESGGFWQCSLAPNFVCKAIKGPKTPGFLYNITALSALDDADDVLALYRYYDPFNGPHSMITRLKWDGKGLVWAQDLAKIDGDLADNYEGIAAVKTPNGHRLYLISDVLHDDDIPHLLVYDWAH